MAALVGRSPLAASLYAPTETSSGYEPFQFESIASYPIPRRPGDVPLPPTLPYLGGERQPVLSLREVHIPGLIFDIGYVAITVGQLIMP
jgi:hypothetical protein